MRVSYGWVVVAAGMLLTCIGMGSIFSLAVFLQPIAADTGWTRTGRALYMADFLEPGRQFARADRAFLADHLVHDFDGVFRQVLRMRIEWTVREGKALFPETVALWNLVR